MIGNKKDKNIKTSNKQGFTLMEVLVSVTLFSIIILSATNIFKLAIDAQRNAIATQNVQESLKYFLEVTAKEIRMAQKSEGVCPQVPFDEIYYVEHITATEDILSFKNFYGECVDYFLAHDGDSQRFVIRRKTGSLAQSDFISPAKININDLHFYLDVGAISSPKQPRVTLNLNANSLDSGKLKSNMTLQTSITSRYYK